MLTFLRFVRFFTVAIFVIPTTGGEISQSSFYLFSAYFIVILALIVVFLTVTFAFKYWIKSFILVS